MLRKIVKMFMGALDGDDPTFRTLFEALLDQAWDRVIAQLSNGAEDPLEVLATSLMDEVIGEVGSSNPQAARAFFSVLAENDRLPRGEQLTADELNLLKNLLVEYFNGDEAVRERANEVLALIERKFSQGAFTQAKILLQIFETDADTRLNNERNLFYEDMIMRLGVRRRHEVPNDERVEVRQAFSTLDPSDDAAVKEALHWLASEYYVDFCLSVPVPAERSRWEDAAKHISGDARERLLSYVPPVRWRSPASVPSASVLELTQAHLSQDAVVKHVQRLTKMCYFLLLASGDTGYESFVYSFLGWSRSHMDVEAKTILPVVHRRSVLDELGLQETLDLVFQQYFDKPLKESAALDSSTVEAAWRKFFVNFAALDLNEVPPGHYDVGGFLLDQILDFEQPDPYFGFKLYRLS